MAGKAGFSLQCRNSNCTVFLLHIDMSVKDDCCHRTGSYKLVFLAQWSRSNRFNVYYLTEAQHVPIECLQI